MATSEKPKAKQELDKMVGQLRTIRDEIRVRLHLASAEAKEAWNNLEPTLGEIEQKMGQMTDETKAKAQELLKRFSQLRDRLKEAKPK
jgi:uncharacterized coiled-coil DUF342 family protein